MKASGVSRFIKSTIAASRAATRRSTSGVVLLCGLALTLSLLSCDRKFDSPTLAGPEPVSPPPPSDIQATLLNNGVSLTWTIVDPAEISGFRIYVSENGADGDYQRRLSTTVASATFTGLVSGRQYFFKISSLSKSGFEGEQSPPVGVRIGVLSMTINEDAQYTSSPNVTVFFFAPAGAVLARISESPTLTGAVWESFKPSIDKTLSIGDGIRRLYAQVQFEDGVNFSGVLSDSIILDSRAVIDSVRNNAGGATLAAGDTIKFALYCAEIDGEASVKFSHEELRLFDDGTHGDFKADDSVYTLSWIIPGGLELVQEPIIGTFQDLAFNQAPEVRDASTLNIANPPDKVTLSAQGLSSAAIRLQWTKSSSTDFSSYRIFRGPGPTVGTNDQLVETVTDVNTLVFVDDNLSASTTYAYRVFVFDITDLSTGSNTVFEATSANVPPTAVTLAGRRDSADVILSWTANIDADFESYRIERSTVSNFATKSVIAVINLQSTTDFTDRLPGAVTLYYRVVVFDKQGLSTSSNVITVP